MRKILLIIMAFSFLTATTYSQEDVLRPKGKKSSNSSSSTRTPWALGLEAGIGYNMYSSDLSWRDAITDNPTEANSVFNVFESLSGLSPHLGFFVDYDIDKTFGIHVKFLYNQYKYSGDSDGIVDFSDANTGTYLGTEIVNLELDDCYNFFSFEPHLRINANEELYFLIGPSLNYGIGSRTSEFTYTKEESDIDFVGDDVINENLRVTTASADFKSTRYALNVGAGYKFEVGENLYIAPQVLLNYGLSSYNDEELANINQAFTEGSKILTASNQAINQIRFSITLWFENL